MDAEVTLIHKVRENRIGNRSYTNLQCGSILDEIGDVPGYALYRITLGWRSELQQSPAAFDKCANLRYMQEAIAMRAGHIRIDLGDNIPCAIDRRANDIYRNAQTAVAMLIGRRNHHQSD